MTLINSEMGMWGKDGPTSLNYDFSDLYFRSSGSPEFHPKFGFGGSLYASLEAWAGLKYDMGFGLIGLAKLNLGSVAASLDVSTNAVTSRGIDATVTGAFVDTSAFHVSSSNLNVTSFDIANSSVDIGIGAKLKADLYGGYRYEAGVDIPGVYVSLPWGGGFNVTPDIKGSTSGGDSFSRNLIDLDGKVNLLSLSGQSLADGYTQDFVYGQISAKLPTMTYGDAEHIALGSGLEEIRVSGVSNPFLTASLDIDALVLAAFGLPPNLLSGRIGVDVGIAKALVDYNLLDAKLSASASLEQDFDFTPSIDVTMTAETGETISGKLGDKFDFSTPEGEGDLKVTATYDINGQLTTDTYLRLGSSFDYKLLAGYLEAAVGVNVLGYNIGGSWKSDPFALADGSFPLGGGARFDLFSNTSDYDLGTFTETYTLHYENFVTTASSGPLNLTSHQANFDGDDNANIINGNDLANVINGRGGKDVIHGGKGRDILSGDGGKDIVFGDGGNDTIYDYGGRFTGGAGADRFVIASFEKAVIADFSPKQKDVLDFSIWDTDRSTEDDEAFHFIGQQKFSGAGGEIRFEYPGKHATNVFADLGDLGILSIKLKGHVDLHVEDFVL